MKSMYLIPSISPTREPIRPPKIRKYRVMVIAGGTRVWPQMRRMRTTSRRATVYSAIQLRRAPSALAQALATLLAGLIARELGGGRFAQVTAAVAVCCVPFSMLAGSLLQYTSPDYLWWVLAAWLLLKLAKGRDPPWCDRKGVG